jgi:hypothetical protein
LRRGLPLINQMNIGNPQIGSPSILVTKPAKQP